MELDTRRWWTLQGSCGDSCDITFQKYCDVTAPLSSLCICSYKWCFCQFDSQKGCIVLFCIYFILKTMLLYLLKMCFGFPPLWYLFLALALGIPSVSWLLPAEPSGAAEIGASVLPHLLLACLPTREVVRVVPPCFLFLAS